MHDELEFLATFEIFFWMWWLDGCSKSAIFIVNVSCRVAIAKSSGKLRPENADVILSFSLSLSPTFFSSLHQDTSNWTFRFTHEPEIWVFGFASFFLIQHAYIYSIFSTFVLDGVVVIVVGGKVDEKQTICKYMHYIHTHTHTYSRVFIAVSIDDEMNL